MKMKIVFENHKIRDVYMNGEKKFAFGDGNSCIDIRSAEDTFKLNPGETKVVKTGFRVQIDHDNDHIGWWITSRSGMASKGVLCHLGTIDHNYRGVSGVCLTNLSKDPINIEFGDRIAQLIVQRIEKPDIEFVETLNETERGDRGFGSSGVK